MPLFEYRCEECGQEYEVLVRGDEAIRCPTCESPRQERLLSVSAARVGSVSPLPVMEGCPPSDAPPCHPQCCRLP